MVVKSFISILFNQFLVGVFFVGKDKFEGAVVIGELHNRQACQDSNLEKKFWRLL